MQEKPKTHTQKTSLGHPEERKDCNAEGTEIRVRRSLRKEKSGRNAEQVGDRGFAL